MRKYKLSHVYNLLSRSVLLVINESVYDNLASKAHANSKPYNLCHVKPFEMFSVKRWLFSWNVFEQLNRLAFILRAFNKNLFCYKLKYSSNIFISTWWWNDLLIPMKWNEKEWNEMNNASNWMEFTWLCQHIQATCMYSMDMIKWALVKFSIVI